NLDVRIGEYDPAIRETDVTAAEAAFDAVLFASAQFDLTDQANIDSGFYNQTITTTGGNRVKRIPTDPFTNTHDYNYLTGLRKLLPTGATVQVAQQLRRLRDLNDEGSIYRNPFYEFGLQLQVKQPLLRDFGVEVNRAAILASRNNYRISQQQFQLLLIKTIAEVESNYWYLFASRQSVRILQELVDSAQNSLHRIQQRGKHDTQSLTIERTLAVIKRSRANLVSAQNTVKQRQELLLQSLNDPNLPLDKKWEIIPVDQPIMTEYKTDYSQAIQTALQGRPEIIAQRYRLNTAGLAEDVAENQRLPRLDMFYQQEITGAGDQYHSSWGQQWSNETVNHMFGFSFEFPVGNRAAEAAYGKTQRQHQQEKLALESIREQVLTDVNNSMHNLTNSYLEISERLAVAEAEKNVTLNHLAFQESGQRNTMSPEFLNLKLNSDERLANARITAVQTIIQYNLAIINIHRAQGTLLRYYNVDVTDE
ncbi:MAG: TolC family protein, partial [Sedimentisphaerales bacterium]|nr:TolC family protein [Sedimentisphaerales bacterium]